MGEHWYDHSGAPAYEVVSAKGTPRATTLADARKIGLVPSVTTVLAVLAKPALETWKIKQGILAALTLPRLPTEPDDTYLRRVLDDSGQQAKKAAEEGTRIHNACERAFQGRPFPEQYEPHVLSVRAEIACLFPGVNDWVAERSFSSPLGYGGKVDLHSPSTGFTVDYKGKDGDFSDGKKLAYDQHWQLSPYQRGLNMQLNVSANIFVSRSHPGKIASHVWSLDEMREGWEVFEAALVLWKRLRRFDSSFVPAIVVGA